MKRPLSYGRIALRGAWFYRRTQLSVFAGCTVATAVLVGGLLVGDSVSRSLHSFALQRLGKTRIAVHSMGRYFDSNLAGRLEQAIPAPIAPVLVLRGTVTKESTGGEPIQVNRVQVIGVNQRFRALCDGPGFSLDDGVGVNSKLAAALGVGPGTDVSLRLEKPSLLPRDAPMASRGERLTRRVSTSVSHTIPDGQLGRFSLEANQVSPHSVFIDLDRLQEVVGMPGLANVLLVGEPLTGELSEESVSRALRDTWALSDVGIELLVYEGVTQLESRRIYLEAPVSETALAVAQEREEAPVGVLAYLVNEIRSGSRSTPYSFAVAVSPAEDRALGPVPPGMRDDEVIINEWVARQLAVGQGDTVAVRYYELPPGGGFQEREREFTVSRVISMEELAGERARMPLFPGLTDVDRCREWDVGLPMDEAALADEANEKYWEAYGVTPKLVFTLAAGREMWANRFGNTSAVRYRTPEQGTGSLRKTLTRAIDPAQLGLFPVPVREQALQAVSESMSFGMLFTSMSFVLIIAALTLTGLLFAFGVRQRAEEMGILRGTGYRPGQVRRLFLLEGAVVAWAGAVAGGVLGTGYTRLMIAGLARTWKDAVGGAAIEYHAGAHSLVTGVLAGFLCAMVAIAVTTWRMARRPARELLAGELDGSAVGRTTPTGSRAALLLSVACTLAAVGIVAFATAGGSQDTVPVFFGAGFFLLLAGLFFARHFLCRLDTGDFHRFTVAGMGIRNAARRPGRSLAVVGVIACGCFLVFAVSSMRQDLAASAPLRSSGTGGFSLFGETTLPMADALETERGRRAFGLDREGPLDLAAFVSIRVRDGDDASCFNLNRAQSPRLLGVDPAAFSERRAFMQSRGSDEPWSLLDSELPEGVVPGLAGDANTATWNLGKKVGPESGGEIAYRDERGDLFRVRLVGALPMPLSVFQGTVLITKSDFETRYPSEAGYRMFLVDLPAKADPVAASQLLARKLGRWGVGVTTTLSRLLEFHGVERTYLGMFLVLGGLGVVLGTVGLAIVVLRNVLERRSELAVVRCLGFSRSQTFRVVFSEHWMLLFFGLVIGAVSALVAMIPSLAAPGVDLPGGTMAVVGLAIVLAGILSTGLAVCLSTRGDLVPALRQE